MGTLTSGAEIDIKEGDIFVCTWGCINRNVDFYRVIRRTKCFVVVRKLTTVVAEEVYRDGPAGANLVIPGDEFDPNDKKGEMRKKILAGKSGSLKMYPFAWARRWDGKPVEEIFGYY